VIRWAFYTVEEQEQEQSVGTGGVSRNRSSQQEQEQSAGTGAVSRNRRSRQEQQQPEEDRKK